MSETYYQRNRATVLEQYRQNRLAKLAYQKEYTIRRKASGWVPKKYIRKSRAKPKPEPKVILTPLPDEPEPPVTQVKRQKKPPPAPFVWKEASFSMTLK